MSIKCDKCRADVGLMLLQRTEDDLQYFFLKCPECGAEIPCSVTDPELRRDIETFKHMAQTIQRDTDRVTEAYILEAQELYRKNLKRGRILLDQYSVSSHGEG